LKGRIAIFSNPEHNDTPLTIQYQAENLKG
jgi:hypothetical protein